MKTLILTLLITLYSMFAFANTTQNNTSGSNTSITGDTLVQLLIHIKVVAQTIQLQLITPHQI